MFDELLRRVDRDRSVPAGEVYTIVVRDLLEMNDVLEVPTDDHAAAANGGDRHMQGIGFPCAADDPRIQIRLLKKNGGICRIDMVSCLAESREPVCDLGRRAA